MARSRVDRILEQWTSVANGARRPAAPPRAVVVRGGRSGATLAGASLVVVALLVAVAWLGRPGPNGSVGEIPSRLPSPTSTLEVTPSPSAHPTPTLAATPAASPSQTPPSRTSPSANPTPVTAIGPCDPATLAARITLWEGAAGHRIANVELTNAGSVRCTLHAMSKPQLVDGPGSVLIDGSKAPTSASLTLDPGAVLKTLVDTSNYCGPTPVAPVTVAFVLSASDRIVATPVSPKDATVPPCNGPGLAGEIQMHPWAP